MRHPRSIHDSHGGPKSPWYFAGDPDIPTMIHISKTLCLAGLVLVACDLGNTKLGDLTAGDDCGDSWTVRTAFHQTGYTFAGAVLALDDGFLLGGAEASDRVAHVDASGHSLWSTELGAQSEADILDLVPASDGGYVAIVHALDLVYDSRRQLRVVGLSAGGELEWESSLGSAHYMAWATGDVLAHPEGGYVVSWEDSVEDGNDPRMVLARIDEVGTPSWSVAYPLAAGSVAGENWSHGTAALLGDGSILQLAADDGRLRLLRTNADGGLMSDALVEDTVAYPRDMVVLPDGAVLVLAVDVEQSVLLEVETDGTLVATHGYSGGGDISSLDCMMWDPTVDALYMGGEARIPPADVTRPWTVLVDRQGNEIYNAIDADNSAALVVDVARLPSGGFVASRFHGVNIETVETCVAG
jgi:hypothetical protein